MALTVPLPRTSPDGDCARWYEDGLGWATAGGPPAQLLTGLRFDVLELPSAAGFPLLRRLDGQWPVALEGRRMHMLVAAGSAEELPGLLDWLEWGGVALDLAVRGTGGRMTAPVPPGWSGPGPAGAPTWLRPPVPGHEVEPTLPALPTVGGGSGAPGLARLVDAAAAECHRVRLLSAGSTQWLAAS